MMELQAQENKAPLQSSAIHSGSVEELILSLCAKNPTFTDSKLHKEIYNMILYFDRDKKGYHKK
jgi:hypothetical protein